MSDMDLQPKLLRSIPQHVHSFRLRELEKLRQEHPAYRDDQLLMYLLCTTQILSSDIPLGDTSTKANSSEGRDSDA